jgi:hypothetical protein
MSQYCNAFMNNKPNYRIFNGPPLHYIQKQFLCSSFPFLFIVIQFFIIYVPSQQPQGQLQTQHSTDIHNYNGHTQHKVKGKLQEHVIAEKQTNK